MNDAEMLQGLCLGKLQTEVINTLVGTSNNTIQQNALRDKVTSLTTDLITELSKAKDVDELETAFSHFVWGTSSLVEGLGLSPKVENNFRQMVRNDVYKAQEVYKKVTERGESNGE